MNRIALIVSKELKDYALDVFSRHPEFRGRLVCVISWAEHLPALSNNAQRALRAVGLKLYSAVKLLQLGASRADSVLLVGENSDNVMNMLYRVVFMRKNRRNIFLVKPFCSCSRIDFIESEDFDARFVRRVDDSEESFPIAEDMLQQTAPFTSSTEKIFSTTDGISACERSDVFVKISDSCLVGCTYTHDGTIFDSCINGKKIGLYDLRISTASSTEPDIIYDEEVCPLTRIYSAWSCYHFMYEVLDKLITAEELGFKGKYMLFRNPYARVLLELLGLDTERVIWIDSHDAGKLFLLRKAFDVEGFTLSSRKGLASLNEFADRVRQKLAGENNSPQRLFVGEGEAPCGFVSVSPSEHSPDEMINLFCSAEAVMSRDDPALANILFMRSGSEVIDMFPHNWGDMLSDVIALRGLQYRNE